MYVARASCCSSSPVPRMQRLLPSCTSSSIVLSTNPLRPSTVVPCNTDEAKEYSSGCALIYAKRYRRLFHNPRVVLTTKTRYFCTAALATTRVSCATSSPPAAHVPPTVTHNMSDAKQATAKHASATTEPPVSPALIQEIKAIMSRHPTMRWMPVSDLYADLPLRTRREQVRPHKSMLHVLQKVKGELGISLSATGVFYAVGKMPEVAPKIPQKAPQQQQQQQSEKVDPSTVKESGSSATPLPPQSMKTAVTATSSPGAALNESIIPSFPPVDFFYDVGLKEFPPPPADLDINAAQLQRHVAHSSVDGAVIAMRDFVTYIPPFFTPVSEVLVHMPGYTEEHIQRYFQAATMEVVTVSGERYIRVHGGYEKLSLVGCEAAEETFRQFRPQPSLAEHFEKVFEGVTDKWMPLPELLSRADPAVVAQLPFQGPAAVMYFAQMQHKFAFAVRQLPPQRDGAAPATEAAVLLRRPDYGGLECATTPTPKSLSYLFTLVPTDGQVEIIDVERKLPAKINAEVKEYYGSLLQFFMKHATIFYVPPETPTVVMRLRYRQRVHVATLSLEEQLKFALESHKKAKARVIRRRIAFRDNPSNPLLDPENLAKELSKHLPRRGFVSVKMFLRRSIPEELVMFLPPKVHNFFKSYPQYFTQFEYQNPGSWCLCRPDQPLPRGVIRQSFSEVDLIRMIAEYLQKKGPRSLSTVLLNVPRGAQNILKKRYGGMYFFVIRFPQYFNVVLGADNNNAQSSGIVHLIQVPSADLAHTALATAAAASNDPNAPTIEFQKEKMDIEDEGDDDDYDGLD